MVRDYQRVARQTVIIATSVVWLGVGHPHGQGRSAAVLGVPSGDVQVYKQPGCGCCELWARHMRAAGFRVAVEEAADVEGMKRRHAIPINLRSCHTSVVGASRVYRLEGHVPANIVRRLLSEKPAVAGIAVPGMPIGSPGMESGSRRDPYDVIAFDADGRQRVFTSVNK
ncbi:MAG TPA: DUF411 domain-containing protein [Vicinamibacterales bacterium]|jgi:hypothetical protein|nr:DUF411 domain-containing protein [Vicinamibacterales bacterium]